MAFQNMHDLYLRELSEWHSAESRTLEALPRMAGATQSKQLREAFDDHRALTAVHRDRNRHQEMMMSTRHSPKSAAAPAPATPSPATPPIPQPPTVPPTPAVPQTPSVPTVPPAAPTTPPPAAPHHTPPSTPSRRPEYTPQNPQHPNDPTDTGRPESEGGPSAPGR